MKINKLLPTVLFGASLLIGGCHSAHPPHYVSQQWEYRVLDLPSGRVGVETLLNDQGKEGWNLVGFSEFQDKVGGKLISKRPRN